MTFVPHKKKPLLARILEWLNEPEEWPAWVQFVLLPRPLGRENFFVVRVVLLFAMAFFTLQAFAGGYESWIAQFLHNLNLPVHETGHIVFRIFGSEVITSLGGSLFQTIMPLVFCFALWIKPRDLFGASVALTLHRRCSPDEAYAYQWRYRCRSPLRVPRLEFYPLRNGLAFEMR